MKAELTSEELETIGKIVAKELYKMSSNDNVYKEIDLLTSAYLKRNLEHYNPIINTIIESSEIITPIVKKIFNENKMLEGIARQMIFEHFNTESFKKLSIKLLHDRIKSIEEELYNTED